MGNILKLVSLGYLPPDYKESDLKLTLYYKLWEYFRVVCVYAEFSMENLEDIRCRKTGLSCDFDSCPVVERAIKMYQQALKYAHLYDDEKKD